MEQYEHDTLHDIFGDPGCDLDLPTTADLLDHLSVLYAKGFYILGVDLDSADRLSTPEVFRSLDHGWGVQVPDASPG